MELKPANLTYEDEVRNQLTGFAYEWVETGNCPDHAHRLASQQFTALVLMAGRECELRGPIADFLYIDPMLQRIVLKFWGRTGLIGQQIGVD